MLRQAVALRETLRALVLVVRTSVLFRGGNAAVTSATREGLDAVPSTRAELDASGVDPWLLLRAVTRARRMWPAPVLCLQTAMVFRGLLVANGLQGRLRLGVRKSEDAAIEAHAWVEVADIAFDPDRLEGGFLSIDAHNIVERAL